MVFAVEDEHHGDFPFDRRLLCSKGRLIIWLPT